MLDQFEMIDELKHELEQQWPAMLADLRASGVPLNEAGDGGGAGDGGDGGAGDGGSAGDGGAAGDAAGAGDDAGAAGDSAGAGAGDGAGTPVAPSFNFDEWAASDEGQQQLGETFETWATRRAEAQAQAEAAAQAAAQNPFADVEEALGLLGIDPERWAAFNAHINAPALEAAARMQAEQATEWVDQQLTGLGEQHPDLLGTLEGLAELKNAEGEPLFKPEEVLTANRNAVLFAASALEQAARADGKQLAPDKALALGVEQTMKRDEVIGKIAVEKYKAELSAVGGAARDLTGTGGGGTERTEVQGDELALARRLIADRAAAGAR